jgi:hypothetical protein
MAGLAGDVPSEKELERYATNARLAYKGINIAILIQHGYMGIAFAGPGGARGVPNGLCFSYETPDHSVPRERA